MPGRFRELINEATHTLGGATQTWSQGNLIQRSEFWVDSPQSYRRCWDATHPGPPYAEGGGLTIMKAGNPENFIQGAHHVYGMDFRPDLPIYNEYIGGFWPNGYGSFTFQQAEMRDVGIAGPYGPNYGSGSSYGAAAYNRYKPKMNTANLGQTVGEASQLLPMLKQSAKGLSEVWRSLGGSTTEFGPKKVADHFLNHSFGWVPFVNDMVDSYRTYKNTDKAMRRLRKQNGRWEHRGGTVDLVSEASFQSVANQAGAVYPNLPSQFYSDAARSEGIHVRSELRQEYLSRAWFEGRFRYHIPSLGVEDNNYNKVMNRVQTYGLRVSPTLIWKITPWSWLADWYGNAGDIISNADDNLWGLASLYAYVMRTTVKRNVNSSTIRLKGGDVNCTWSQEIVTKTRHGSSSFGFGLDPGDYTPFQISILAALGVSKR